MDFGVGVPALKQGIDQVGVVGYVLESGGQAVAYAIEVGPQPHVIDAGNLHHAVDVVGDHLEVGVEGWIFLLETVNHHLSLLTVHIDAGIHQAGTHNVAEAILTFAQGAIEKAGPKVNLNDPAIFPKSLDHSIVHIPLEANGGCEAVLDTLFVNIIPSPTPGFDFTEVCFGETATFTNTSTSEDDEIDNYIWTFEPGETATTEDAEHSFSGEGTYDVELIVISENGCSDTIVQQVRSHYIPRADFGIPFPCLNGGTAFFDSTTVGADAVIVDWLWDFGDNTPTDTAQNPVHQYAVEGTYDITLAVTSEFGCQSDTTITEVIFLGPIAAFNANPPSANLFVDISFTDQTVENGAPLAEWEWNFGDGDFAFDQDVIHQYDFEGQYEVILIVTDELGCIDTATKVVPIYHGPLIPSGFSPNGDGNNDILNILGGNFEAVDFKVYNNWGEVVYATQDVDTQGWDGTFKGEPQPLGVYVYVARVITYDGVEHILSGDVSLIR